MISRLSQVTLLCQCKFKLLFVLSLLTLLLVLSYQYFSIAGLANTNTEYDKHIKSQWLYERPLPKNVHQNVKSWYRIIAENTERNNFWKSVWIYERPLSKALLQDIKAWDMDASLHVFCGTFACVKDLANTNRITASFLVISTLINNTVFDTWFRRHPLNKILEEENFEDHLQQVVALTLIFRKGGTYFDPRLKKELLHTLPANTTCIAVASSTNLPSIVGLFNFPKEHPLIWKIGEVMLNQYKRDADDVKKWPIRFNFREISSIACKSYPDICAKIIDLDSKHFYMETPNIENSFGTLSYDARVRVAGDANLGDEIQGFPGLQFLPFMNEFVETDQLHSTNKKKNITTFFNAWWGSPSQQWPPPMHIDPIMLSMHLGNSIKPMITNNLPYLKGKSPIGCHDPATLEFLRSQGVEAFYSSCMTLMMKNPSKGAERTDNIYLVDVNDAVRKLLPSEIQQKGISLEHNMKGESRLNKLARFKSAYSLIEKYARAKLVVTQRIHCALPCVAMGTPVIFINSASMPGGGGTKRKGSPRTEGFQELFHMLDLYNMSSNDAKMWLQNFDWNKPRPLSSSSSLLKRLRATSWNIIRQKRKLHESALKFGIIPYHNSLLEEDRKEQDLFHLIFTTRGAQVVEVFSDKSNVSARFNWRHWRCIESIFYHHPLAKVLVHSNTLPLAMFEVLEESGYDIEVRRYNLLDIVKSTPAEKFMKEKYKKVRNGKFWYSHETDLLRTAILYKMGGVYMDTDVILVRSLRKLPINVVGYEVDGKMMNGALMYFQKNHQFLFDILRRFNQEYDPNEWVVVGPRLITKILHLNSSAHYNVTVLNHHAFYMFHYEKINDECFQQTNGTTFRERNKILKENAFAVHTYSKFSGKIGLTEKLKEGTICKKLFNAYCILCDKRY